MTNPPNNAPGKKSAPKPVLIELEGTAPASPADAPPVPDDQPILTEGRAMQRLARLTARRSSFLGRWFWRIGGALLGFVISLMAWDFVTGLLARNSYLGGAALILTGLFALVLLALAIREWAAIARLGRIDGLRRAAQRALVAADLGQARSVTDRLAALYAGRDELGLAREKLEDGRADILDADALLEFAETQLLAPLDASARLEVEAAARQVATVTAIVPLALADVVAALSANLRMIRRIAEIYGGRAGLIGSWRLARTVMTHLVATGAVSVGDDLIGSVAGGGILSKLSRRFGEGLINGALTARVGVAAIEVCRPLAFRARPRPSVSSLVKRALTGLFPG